MVYVHWLLQIALTRLTIEPKHYACFCCINEKKKKKPREIFHGMLFFFSQIRSRSVWTNDLPPMYETVPISHTVVLTCVTKTQ